MTTTLQSLPFVTDEHDIPPELMREELSISKLQNAYISINGTVPAGTLAYVARRWKDNTDLLARCNKPIRTKSDWHLMPSNTTVFPGSEDWLFVFLDGDPDGIAGLIVKRSDVVDNG